MIKMSKANHTLVLNIESTLSSNHVLLHVCTTKSDKGKEVVKSDRVGFSVTDTGAIIEKATHLLKRFIKKGFHITSGEPCTLFPFTFEKPNPLLALSWLNARVQA